MNYCPCCSGLLLQHIRSGETYWFCRECWQEMPVYNWKNSSSLAETVIGKLPRNSQTEKLKSTPAYLSKRQSISGWIGVQDLSA
ncbi:hypothetical protein WKK05_17400 [Nostoc sp. UHCC 0302]|uniref:hypothetical protein n=1 Tax=Nostoc sp. UHCC 0302 TaxID=3134896 RepID=UPI00311CCEC7